MGHKSSEKHSTQMEYCGAKFRFASFYRDAAHSPGETSESQAFASNTWSLGEKSNPENLATRNDTRPFSSLSLY